MPYFSDVNPATLEGRIEILNRLHADEIRAAMQYWNHYVAFRGPNSISVQGMLDAHAQEEMGHAKKLLDRIAHLRGLLLNSFAEMALINPAAQSGSGDIEVADSPDMMLSQDLQGELVAIEAYTEAILLLRDHDPGTAHILTEILLDEQEHQHELDNLLS